jgi:hypothetical protein
MKNATIIAICLGIFLCGAPQLVRAQIAAPDLNLSFANWSTKQAKALNAEPKDAVSKFVSNLLGLHLCSFQFVDLRHSGQLSLVLSDDGGGTADCNYLQILDKMPSGIENYDFQTVAGDTYLDGVKDLNGDGHYEVIVDVYFASGGSIDHCDATWPVIYAWTGHGYSDVSRDFKNYYQQRLTSLQKQIAAAEAQKEQAATGAAPVERALPTPTFESQSNGAMPAGVGLIPAPSPALQPPATLVEDRRGLDCDKAEAAKLERFLGISRDAGMSDAIKWANSDNPLDRSFAADIFADIGTGQAQEYLKTLSHDPDRSVAMSVKGWVSEAKPSATYPTVKGELISLTPGYPPAK